MKLSVVQILTVVGLIAFGIYELWYLPRWMATLSPDDAVIRTDLIIFVPVLIILVIISVIQFFRKKK